ncbi:lipoprotein [Mesoplasma photuris]|uniref:lipoprotein n=1 Tax=Mesoplasma photuris TaxID=217731 RepID=UPI0004E1E4BF|nr:lipoprotein [Mesoplasma photuris]
MKKLLSILTAVTVGGTTATTVVACGVKTHSIKTTADFTVTDGPFFNYEVDENGENGKYVANNDKNTNYTASDKVDERSRTNMEMLDSTPVGGKFSEMMRYAFNLLNFGKSTSVNGIESHRRTYSLYPDEENSMFTVDGYYQIAGDETMTQEEYYTHDKFRGINSIPALIQYNEYLMSNPNFTPITEVDQTALNALNSEGEAGAGKEFVKVYKGEKDSSFIEQSFNLAGKPKVTNGHIAKMVDSQTGEEVADADLVFKEFGKVAKINAEKNIEGEKIGGLSLDPFKTLTIGETDVNSILNTGSVSFNPVLDDDAWKTENETYHIFKNSDTPTGKIADINKFDIREDKSEGDEKVKREISARKVFLDPVGAFDVIYKFKADMDDSSSSEFDIKVEIDGLNAIYQPKIMEIVTGKTTDEEPKDIKHQIVGWQLVGYQFNNDEIAAFDANGDSKKDDYSKAMFKDLKLNLKSITKSK